MLTLFNNGVEVELIAKSNSQSIRVALNRVHLCPAEIAFTESEGSVASETKNLISREP